VAAGERVGRFWMSEEWVQEPALSGKCGRGGGKRLLSEWGSSVESKMEGVHR
jgi:hypothetical protein